jgi:hypothetical protein
VAQQPSPARVLPDVADHVRRRATACVVVRAVSPSFWFDDPLGTAVWTTWKLDIIVGSGGQQAEYPVG